MVAKKKTAAVMEGGFLTLTTEHLWKWRALDAELRAASTALDVVRANIQAEIAKNSELVALLARQHDLASSAAQAASELVTMRATIETSYGVKLEECSIDDRTGRLHDLTSDGTPGKPKTTQRTKRKN